MRRPASCLVVIGAVTVVLSGCASHDRDRSDADRPDPVLATCSSKIDAQIAAGLIPSADREYATEMCLRVP